MGKPTSFGIAIFILKALEFVLENFRVSVIYNLVLYCFSRTSFFIAIVVTQNCSDNPVRKFSESVEGKFDEQQHFPLTL